MNTGYQEFIKQLNLSLSKDLPGAEAQKLMAPNFRPGQTPDNDTRKAAVLLLIFPKNNKLHLLFIKRSVYEGVHSGQIAFPGGQYEPGDLSLKTTAIRETNEEVGIVLKPDQIIGRLTQLYIPVSNFLVTPYIAAISTTPKQYKPAPEEVAAILEIPLEKLFSKSNQKRLKVTAHKTVIDTPAYTPDDNIIWGATAMMLSEFEVLVKSPQSHGEFTWCSDNGAIAQ